jgi:hypothetical protein
MKGLATGLAVTVMSIGIALAQNAPSVGARPGSDQSKAAAGGNDNQAVATNRTDANTPARGANSFTAGEARSRIEARGFANITGLHLDQDGVWRGQATKDGRTAAVWLDYKGNIGQQM